MKNRLIQAYGRQTGFTLVELIITIAVMAVVASFAMPSITNQIAAAKINDTSSILKNMFRQAKVESVIKRKNVTVNIDSSAKIISASDDDGTTQYDRYQFDKSIVIKANPAALSSITFTPQKRALISGDATFTICDSNNKSSPKQVVINSTGNVALQTGGSC